MLPFVTPFRHKRGLFAVTVSLMSLFVSLVCAPGCGKNEIAGPKSHSTTPGQPDRESLLLAEDSSRPRQSPPLSPVAADRKQHHDGTVDAKLRLASWQTIRESIATPQRVTVVDLWALSCHPCVKALPELVKLNQQLDQSIRCVTVNIDFDGRKSKPPAHYQETANELLTEIGADFENYLCSDPSEQVLDELGILSIPAVLIYDEDGSLVHQFTDSGADQGFTYQQDVLPWLRQHLDLR